MAGTEARSRAEEEVVVVSLNGGDRKIRAMGAVSGIFRGLYRFLDSAATTVVKWNDMKAVCGQCHLLNKEIPNGWKKQ